MKNMSIEYIVLSRKVVRNKNFDFLLLLYSIYFLLFTFCEIGWLISVYPVISVANNYSK